MNEEEYDDNEIVNADKWYNSTFATELGQGVFIFLLFAGMGTCSLLTHNTKIVFIEDPQKVEQTITNEN